MKKQHASERTCIWCRKKIEKHHLVRFVLNERSDLVLDPEQKLSGRGTYTCRDLNCLENAMKKNLFSRSLKRPALSIKADGLFGQLSEYLEMERAVSSSWVERG